MAAREFEGRTALVTGGARGIGRATCVALARAGAKVAINYAANEAAARAAATLVEAEGAEAALVRADVSDEGAVARMVAEAESRLGPIDLLVTSAGIGTVGGHGEVTFDDWRRTMAVNLDGTYLPVMAVKDGMIARGYGRIVCISSIAGLAPRPAMIAYATSKAAVVALVRNLAAGLGPTVRVNAVAPGLVTTEMSAGLDKAVREAMVAATPLQRAGTPEDIAEAVLFLLSDRAAFITGQTLVADGGRVTLP